MPWKKELEAAFRIAKDLFPDPTRGYQPNSPEPEEFIGIENPPTLGVGRDTYLFLPAAFSIAISQVTGYEAEDVLDEIKPWYDRLYGREKIPAERAHSVVDNLRTSGISIIKGVDIESCIQDGVPMHERVNGAFSAMEQGSTVVLPMPYHEVIGGRNRKNILWGVATGFQNDSSGEVTISLPVSEGIVRDDLPNNDFCNYLSTDNSVSDGNTGFIVSNK